MKLLPQVFGNERKDGIFGSMHSVGVRGGAVVHARDTNSSVPPFLGQVHGAGTDTAVRRLTGVFLKLHLNLNLAASHSRPCRGPAARLSSLHASVAPSAFWRHEPRIFCVATSWECWGGGGWKHERDSTAAPVTNIA